jgi:hypothetical protein
MATPLQRGRPTFQAEGTLTAYDGLAFFILYDYLFILLNNFFSRANSVAQKSCMLTLYPTSNTIFSRGKLGWACNVSIIFCGDGKLVIFHYFVNFTHQP